MRYLSLLLLTTSLHAATLPPDMGFGGNMADHVEVNNRILLKINGKPISVMDVVRKMDLLFYQQYPTLVSHPAARYEFYTTSWRNILAQVIDDKLICADAEEKHVEVSDGEVREELERVFGPNVVLTTDKLGLTFEEAWDLVRTELTVQRMASMMVYSKALADIHPIEVKRRYERDIAANPPEDKWIYQVLSIKAGEQQKAHLLAEKAHTLLATQKVPLELIKESLELGPEMNIALSAEYERTPKEISAEHKAILEKLKQGEISAPVAKKGGSALFFLKEYKKGEPTPFSEVATQIKQQLIQEKITKYNVAYRQKLREHYGLTERYLSKVIPDEMNPFALR